ncbi:hypothetical protein EON80_03870 [bacterium]|nr:MAG: hypothetical protein EON80_03870 [bacterium]
MLSHLEYYLHQIERHLDGLMAFEKEQQLLEISQHLQILIAQQQLAGLTEAEAIQAAIKKFGDPAEIGRGILEVTGGSKTGLLKGMSMGAIAGLLTLIIPEIVRISLTSAYYIPSYSYYFDWNMQGPVLLNAIICGALASLVGRRFAKRFQNRPTRSLSVSDAISHGLRLGLWRGAVGGSIFGTVYIYQYFREFLNQGLSWSYPWMSIFVLHFFAMSTLSAALIWGCANAGSSALFAARRAKRIYLKTV